MTVPVGRLTVSDMAQLGDAILFVDKKGEASPTAAGIAHRRLERFVLRAEFEVRTLAEQLQAHARLFIQQQQRLHDLSDALQQEAHRRLLLDHRLDDLQAALTTQALHSTEQYLALRADLLILLDAAATERTLLAQRILRLEGQTLPGYLHRFHIWVQQRWQAIRRGVFRG